MAVVTLDGSVVKVYEMSSISVITDLVASVMNLPGLLKQAVNHPGCCCQGECFNSLHTFGWLSQSDRIVFSLVSNSLFS